MHNRAATVTVLISCRSLNRSFRIDTNIFQIILYRFHRRKFSEIYGYMGGRTALAINNNISKFQLGKAFPTAFSSNRLLCAGIPLDRTLCCNPCCIRNTRSAYPVSGTMCSNTHIFQCGSFPSFCTMLSVRVSMLEVASSRMRTGGSATAALAMESSWRCPWESSSPSPLNMVS